MLEYHCIYQDVAEISPSLFLTIFLIKDIQLGVAGQTFEVSVKNRLRRIADSRLTFLYSLSIIIISISISISFYIKNSS